MDNRPMDSAPDQDRFRSTLRSLRVWDVELPGFDPGTAPPDPLPLFRSWLCEAADAGQPEPHVVSLATAGADGRPDVRIVMLHDADEHGWHFGSHRGSRKGRQLAARPQAALCFYWPTVGRQVRVRGTVTTAPAEAAAADLHARSAGALAAALVGRQSEVLDSYAELDHASDAAWRRAQAEPDADVPSWTLYLLSADEVEFFQGDARRRHVRLRYRRDAGGDWARELLWP